MFYRILWGLVVGHGVFVRYRQVVSDGTTPREALLSSSLGKRRGSHQRLMDRLKVK